VNWYWFICWVFMAPAFMLFIFVFYFIKYKPITYGADYAYPPWGEALGFLISLSSMIWVPGYAIYFFFTTPGTWREVLVKGVTPVIKPRPDAVIAGAKRIQNKEQSDLSEVVVSLINKENITEKEEESTRENPEISENINAEGLPLKPEDAEVDVCMAVDSK